MAKKKAVKSESRAKIKDLAPKKQSGAAVRSRDRALGGS